MRRTDRELSAEEAEAILKQGEYGILSTVSAEGVPYGVPISYAYENGVLFMHCSAEGGLKVQNLKANPRACFTVVGPTRLLPDQFATLYSSAIAFGTVEILTEAGEKRQGIEAILNKYAADHRENGLKYIDAALDRIYILRFSVTRLSGKGRRK